MKRIHNYLFLGVFLLFGQSLFAQNWTIDNSHSSINFTASHFFSKVNGHFNSFDGTFVLDLDNPASGKIDFTIDVSSIDTNNAQRDKHLQSKDFFNAKKYSQIRFTSTSISTIDENTYKVTGTLSIKDTKKTTSFELVKLGVGDNPFKKGSTIAGFEANFSVIRSDYKIGVGNWGTDKVIGDKVDVSVQLELVQ